MDDVMPRAMPFGGISEAEQVEHIHVAMNESMFPDVLEHSC
jgi:hypothetical protein